MTLPVFSLAGRAALVTGGGRGIGTAIARLFAQAGASVLIANRTAAAGEAIAAALRAEGLDAAAIGCDISRREEAEHAVAEAARRFGRLNIVVHNAAINSWSAIDAIDDAALDATLAVNLKACFWLARAALPQWRAGGAGRLLVTSSVTGPRVAMPGSAAYAASKAGVNGVEPGYIAKQGGSLLRDPERAEHIARHIPAGELGRPEDIACAMCFLASDAARYITGQTIVVDGGSTLPESPYFREAEAASA